MDRRTLKKLELELGQYIDSMVAGLGRAERRAALAAYITGLLLDGDRKSVEPMAGRLVDAAELIEGMRQRLLQAVSVAAWPEEEVFRRLGLKLDAELPEVEALVIDDTGFPKKGVHSVGVSRQYSGTLGRVDNCQVAVSLHLAGARGSGCIDLRLFLPEAWASDQARRAAAGVPEHIEGQTKLQIALDQLDRALKHGVRKHVVLADAGYGDSTEFRTALAERGLHYVLGVAGSRSSGLRRANHDEAARRARATRPSIATTNIRQSLSRNSPAHCATGVFTGAKDPREGNHHVSPRFASVLRAGTTSARRLETRAGSYASGLPMRRRPVSSGCL